MTLSKQCGKPNNMDGIIKGISTINFEHYNENCAPNFLLPSTNATSATTTTTTAMTEHLTDFNSLPPVSIVHFEKLARRLKSSGEQRDAAEDAVDGADLNSSTETVAADEIELCRQKCIRRQMPARASKQSNILDKSKRRSIVKPKKWLEKSTAVDITNMRQSEIKKIYSNQKLTNFHPAKLETITEESDVCSDDSHARFLGTRKLKRSLLLRDGLCKNKTLIKQRREKVRRTLGRRFALKKIPLEDFLKHLNSVVAAEEEKSEGELGLNATTTTATLCTNEAMDAEDVQ